MLDGSRASAMGRGRSRSRSLVTYGHVPSRDRGSMLYHKAQGISRRPNESERWTDGWLCVRCVNCVSPRQLVTICDTAEKFERMTDGGVARSTGTPHCTARTHIDYGLSISC
jgi:hypothetical protein